MNRHTGPETIGAILRGFIEGKGLANKLKHLEIYGAWEEAVGPIIQPHTRVAGFAHHKLYVDVDSATHLHELQTFLKRQLMNDLRGKLPNVLIQDIVFRPGLIGRS
jgi:predicted nucleic acid-binding Zn ribbon protein